MSTRGRTGETRRFMVEPFDVAVTVWAAVTTAFRSFPAAVIPTLTPSFHQSTLARPAKT